MNEEAGVVIVQEIPAKPSVEPFSAEGFSACMAAFEPFEAAPALAVAVSGGADSLALTLLAAEWAAARGGELTALTVDHRLRPESGAEARQVAAWLRPKGIAHHILTWREASESGTSQEAARRARYRLLGDWCREAGILHLLLAHHRDDQAETLLLRLAAGSGPDGLAGASAMAETDWGRMLRPLLGVAPERLRAWLSRQGQPWIEDPSNHKTIYARARLRASRAVLGEEGLSPSRLAQTARRAGRARASLERQAADLLAAATRPHPAGFLWLQKEALRQADPEPALRVLGACLTTIGARPLPPRLHRLEALLDTLRQGPGAGPGAGPGERDCTEAGGHTLGGCRLVARSQAEDDPSFPGGEKHKGEGWWLIFREPAGLAEPILLRPGTGRIWDARFFCRLDDSDATIGRAEAMAFRLGALGMQGWRGLKALLAPTQRAGIPPLVAPTLPAVWCHREQKAPGAAGRPLDLPLSVPHFSYQSPDGPRLSIKMRWQPPRALSEAWFAVA